MADKTIGDLTRATVLYTADLIPIEQGGNAKSITGNILAQFAREKGAQAAASAEGYAEDAAESAAKAESWSKHPPYIGENGNWWVYDIITDRYVDSGVDASITVAIADITMLAEGADPYVTNTGTDTDCVFHLFLPRGQTGATGNGIASIVLNPDYTLTITYTNGQSYTSGSIRGATGNGISSIVLNQDYTLTINYTDGESFTTTSIRGATGEKGDQGDPGNDGADGADGVSPEVTITGLANGHRVTITDAEHPSGQSFDVLDGTGAGDMTANVYDPDGDVAEAGGIAEYMAEHGATITMATDEEVDEALDTLFPTTD